MTEIETSLRRESRDRYLTYALSVVTGRALPDIRDGLKPVQRRILYTMFHELKLRPEKSHRKSAAVVGAVLAQFHPHGDTACYEAMVRMAQDFSLRYPLVDGQGNFGSLDGDGAAAYRYTEAKLLPLALEVLGEIDQETVDFRDNFDATTQEPTVLPSRVPHLLMNGASGIAVGMATNIPPHNLSDIVKALNMLLDDPEATTAKLVTVLKGPDFPTGCTILNTKKELTDIYQTGRGAVRMRGDWKLEDGARGKRAAIVTSIPYALNKAQLIEKIADLIATKKVPQFVDIRDESTTDIRIVLELAPEADVELGMAYLFKHSPLEGNFQVNLTALTPTASGVGKPELVSLKQCLRLFLDFRIDVTERRLRFERKNLLERIHVLEGFVLIYDALDEALQIVRKSSGRQDSADKLRKRFKLSEIQAYAVVDMRIYQLSRTNIADIRAELKEKESRVAEIESILKSKKKIEGLVAKDLAEIDKLYGDKRRSKIEARFEEIELKATDFVVREEVYAIVTQDGWIKRIRQTNDFTTTRLREGDILLHAHPVTTVDSVLFFTNLGYFYELPVSEFPSSSGYGDPIQKILKFKDGERVVASFSFLRPEDGGQQELPLDAGEMSLKVGDVLVLVSERGTGFGLQFEAFDGIKKSGKRIMKFREGDSLASIGFLDTNIGFVTAKGSGLVISKREVPVRSQAAVGVSLMSVRADDKLIGVFGFSRTRDIYLQMASDKEKKVSTSDFQKGRRGLKGKKLVARGDVSHVLI
ncbi:MAG: DNA topoisomerase 4 subunit A [Bdellovibrionales bacterium]|nr:DNA topoisomerase 4 subunit A [Bdellovibrionales bacterium]